MDACEHCGATFTKQTARFCGKCGTRKLNVATATAPASTAMAASTSASPSHARHNGEVEWSKTVPPATTTTATTVAAAASSSSSVSVAAKKLAESQPYSTLRPSSSLQRGGNGPPSAPAVTTSSLGNRATDSGVEGGRLSLNGRVGLDRVTGGGGGGLMNDGYRRGSSLAQMLADAASAATTTTTAPPSGSASSTIEFKDPLTEYTHAQQGSLPQSPSYRRGSTTIMTAGGGGSTSVLAPSSAPPLSRTAPVLPEVPPPRRASSAVVDKPASNELEMVDVEDSLDDGHKSANGSGLFMPIPATSAALLQTEAAEDAEDAERESKLGKTETMDTMLEPDPAQEAQYTAWATLGPDGITPEMLQTGNISDLRGWQKGTLIGRGTYGSVYLGLLRDGSFQAVKCVEIGARASAAGTFDVKELVSLSREINMMQRLRHRNLCKFGGVYYNPQETSICMFMEYIGGGSVSTLVKRFKPLPPQVVRSWTKQLLSGLLYLHAQNIIHRDIKGDNVLVDTSASPSSEAQIKLVDFGAARRLTDAMSQSRTVIGTPYWMAPEVVDLSGDGGGYSYKADVWSVGCTVAEMLTGKPPWPTRTNAPAAIMMIASSEGMPTEIPKEEATPGCYAFMLACFERDPSKRPTVEDLLDHPWITGAME